MNEQIIVLTAFLIHVWLGHVLTNFLNCLPIREIDSPLSLFQGAECKRVLSAS